MLPPKYRNSTILISGVRPHSCGNCVQHYDGLCFLYSKKTAVAKVCDSWEA